MGLPLILFFCSWFSALTALDSSQQSRILFLMQTGHANQAWELYNQLEQHDFGLLQELGLQILEQGYRTGDPETQLLCLYGAGIALHERVLSLLEEGLKSRHPQLQLASLHFLSHYQNNEGDEAINRALTSNYLLIRLEGALHLAKKKSHTAVAQAEALMAKVDEEILPVFPQLFAAAGTSEAMAALRKLLAHRNERVRIAAIRAVAAFQRDDLLPTIRILASQHTPAQQEICALALAHLKDQSSLDKLHRIARSSSSTASLAAYYALYQLGHADFRRPIEDLAKAQDLFAIALLKEIPESASLLYEIAQSSDRNIRINAALGLLQQRDPRSIPYLAEVLFKDERDIALAPLTSPGGGIVTYKVIPSAQQNFENRPDAIERSLQIREAIVTQAVELPEKDFLYLAHLLLESKQNDLVPTVTEALTRLHTPDAIALLKKHQQRTGAPLVRNYCNLALYQLEQEGPYLDQLIDWVASQRQCDLIRFRPLLPREADSMSNYTLTLHEVARLLVDAYAAFTDSKDPKGIRALIDAIQHGNTKNRYALAGLLIRATQ